VGELAVADVFAQVHPDDLHLARTALEGVAADGEPREFDVRFGGDRSLSSRVTRVEQPLGGTTLLGVSMDVTEVRRAEESLRAAERREARHNELVIASAGEGIYALDAELCCTSVNPAAARMLGYEAAELVGRRIHDVVHDRYPDGTPYPESDCPISRCVRDGEWARVGNEVYWRRDGSRLPVEYTTFPILDEGVVRGAVVTFVDATERRGTREETERAAGELRRAIAAGELVLHYQPKVRLDTGACTAVEALVRWQRGTELVYPDAFVPLAEEAGVIDDLTRWVVEEALRTALDWRRSGLDVKVAVNLSPSSLRDDAMVTHLAVAAGRLGSAPSALEVEMTESVLAEDPEALLRNLVALSAMGVHAAIDDFGTGFSSLAYLKMLPVRDLKIDKSFVMNMTHDERDRAIVGHTIGLAHSLGLRAVAEGVEDAEVLRLLRERGCDYGQGYYFSRPVPRDAAEEWLRARLLA
jgi:PAS domain S-box-containing protein